MKLGKLATTRAVDAAERRREEIHTKARAMAKFRKNLIRARRDPSFHNQLVLKSDRGGNIRQDVIHNLWFAFIGWCWRYRLRPFILAPYGTGKSNQLAVGFPLWLTGRDPALQGKVVSNNDDLAGNRVAAIKQYIEGELGDGTYNKIWPEVIPNPKRGWSGTRIFVEREGGHLDPTWQAFGIRRGGAGARSHVNVYDDVVDMDDLISDAVRQHKNSRFFNIWEPRLITGVGLSVGIGTRYHAEDLYGGLMKTPGYCVLSIKVSQDFRELDVEIHNQPKSFPDLEELLHFRWF